MSTCTLHSSVAPQLLSPCPTRHIPSFLFDAIRVAELTYSGVGAGEVDPDEAIVAVDPLAAQALEVQAEDLAIEDTLYALQKAFQAGLLDAPTYLRQVCPYLLVSLATSHHQHCGMTLPIR